MATKKEKIEEVLTKGVEKVYPSTKALRDVLLSRKTIRLYQGFDPSMPNLHLGNLVGILKLKQFQDLGHEVIFLVGDFTGMIGDPTDKSTVRTRLTRKQVLENSKNWKKQASRFLKFAGKNPAKIFFNSRWLDKITFKDLIETTSYFTVQQMIQRDFFQTRIKKKKPIFLHEFLYPVAQAIDCVKMEVDLEVGGNDQTFNMLAGRDLMKAVKGKEKFVLTTKLLVDKEGSKVGKTKGNALFLNASASDMFGKVMAFPDEVIVPGFELLTTISSKTIKSFEQELRKKKLNPVELKRKLALEIVKMNYGITKARKAEKEFERVFKEKRLPTKIPAIQVKESSLSVLELLTKIKLAPSKSEAKRLIIQRGVKIDGQVIQDWQSKVRIKKGMVLQVGKRKFAKVK